MNNPRIEEIGAKRLVGIMTETTLSDHNASVLWQRFMPRLGEIDRDPELGLYSVQIYPKGFTLQSTEMPFEKWAAVPSSDGTVPAGMSQLIIPEGLYAVFIHYGPVSNFPETIKYIFNEWMPESSYVMASRPQFEIMGPDYKGPDDPDSMEEVWIPIELKQT